MEKVWTNFGRCGHVAISFGDGEFVHYRGLDFRFRCKKVMNSFPEGDLEASICGLTHDEADRIVTLCSQAQALGDRNYRKRIRVYAGYRTMDSSPDYDGDIIFEADVYYAVITSTPPDMWVTIKGCIGYWLKYQNTTLSTEPYEDVGKFVASQQTETTTTTQMTSAGAMSSTTTTKLPVTFESVCNELAEFLTRENKNKTKCTYRMDFSGVKDKNILKAQLPSFEKSGSIRMILDALAATTGSRTALGYAVWFDLERDYEAEGEDRWVIKCIERFPVNPDQDVNFVLSKDTGLVGIPTIENVATLKCRSLLNPRIMAGSYITLDAFLMPRMSGDNWQVLTVTHHGELLGNDWYTEIEANDPQRLAGGGATAQK